ncbi:MAG: 30S ribosomal protein S15 [Rickettsiales bacterium]|jgi:small subunit ribosomal protein S15|nr:30S ribosomal protein S15 [Rickettsiales bacterium]
MSILPNVKQEVITKFAITKGDTGSPEVQCAILTTRIRNLTEHFKAHAKDFNSRRGLLMLIGQRKRLLSYVKRKDTNRYATLISSLGLRK